jgi:hypothetical protein
MHVIVNYKNGKDISNPICGCDLVVIIKEKTRKKATEFLTVFLTEFF